MKSALSVLLLCFLLASCGEEKTVKVESKEAKEMRVRAEAGDAEAQSYLGELYYFGEGVPQDYFEAVKWWRKAVEAGNSEAQYNLAAQYNLGCAYNAGEGVPQNSTEAVKWWLNAAEQGYANAQLNLGFNYYSGNGVPKDDVEAAKWYGKAAE